MADSAVSDGIRRVRTPAGVAHFKLPIDTPIGSAPHLKQATATDIGRATRKIVSHLKAVDVNATPRDYNITAAADEMLATQAKSRDVPAILDRHKIDATAPKHTDWVRDYDGLDAATASPETVTEISTAIAYAARFDSDATAYPVDLSGLSDADAIDAVLVDGVNVPRLMDDDISGEQYIDIHKRLAQALDDKRAALEEAQGWEANRANGLDPFDGYSADYKAASVDELKPAKAIEITQAVNDWLNHEAASDFLGARNGRLTDGAQIADFDMPAVTNAIIESRLNVPFLSNPLASNPDYDISDTEFDEIGRALWPILQAHPNETLSVNTVDPTIPARDFSALRGSELVTELATAENALTEAFTGANQVEEPQVRIAVIRDLMASGVNYPALLDPATSPTLRADIVRRMNGIVETEIANQ